MAGVKSVCMFHDIFHENLRQSGEVRPGLLHKYYGSYHGSPAWSIP